MKDFHKLTDDREKVEHLFSLFGKTAFSYYTSQFDEEIKIYDYYKDYAIGLVQFFNDDANSYNKRANQYQFIYDYLVNPEINAGAAINDHQEKIILTEGLILKIYELFYTMNAVYHTVGPFSREPSTLYNLNIVSKFGPDRKINVKFPVSSNKDCNIVAEYMAMLAIKFVIAHEVGHLYNGHCHYRQAVSKKTSSAFMLHNNGDLDIPVMELYAMEINADEFAMCRLIEIVINQLYKDNNLLSVISNKRDIFKILGFSIHGLFSILEYEQLHKKIQRNQSHPPLIIRKMFAFEAARIQALNRASELAVVIDGLYEGIIHCEKILAKIYHNETLTIDKIVDPENEHQMNNIIETWSKLMTKMEKYSRNRLG
ncbi:hypothetical protein [Brevibacillus sp. 179-C9.3 HS]|uniref:hypothetical protein n=1 Tax=unclassified Brevibacillus TaxID=2684853 RepID=UPI00399F825B